MQTRGFCVAVDGRDVISTDAGIHASQGARLLRRRGGCLADCDGGGWQTQDLRLWRNQADTLIEQRV